MKKTTFTIGLAVLIGQAIFAQRNFFIGVSGSVNGAGFTYQNNYGQKKMDYDGLQASPFYGAFVGMAFDAKNQLIAEVNKASYKVKYKDNFSSATYQKSLQLDYTSIPLLYRRLLGHNTSANSSRFFFTVGPQISFLNSASLSQQINGSDVNFTTFVTNPLNPEAAAGVATALTKLGKPQPAAEDLFDKTSIDGIVGIGMLFPVGKSLRISAEFRGGYSFSDLNKSDWRVKGYENSQVVDYKASHAYFGGLRLGIQYNFAGKK